MNVIADDLSRAGQILPTEWFLHQDIVSHVFNQWGHPSVDFLVTRYNKCLNFGPPTLGSVLAKADLVPRLPKPVTENVDSSDAQAAQVQCVPPKPKDAESTCLKTVQTSLKDKGFSKEASRRIMVLFHSPTLCGQVENLQEMVCMCRSRPLSSFYPSNCRSSALSLS